MKMFAYLTRRAGWIALSAVALSTAVTAPGFGQSHIGQLTPRAVGAIIETYYQGPIPEHIPAIIEAAMAQNQVDDRAKRLSLIAFTAGLIAQDAMFVERLKPVFQKLPGEQPLRLARAISYSGRSDWKALLEGLKVAWPNHATAIDALATTGGRAVYQLTFAGQPEVLEMNWAYFGATGRQEPVMAMIQTLAGLTSSDPERRAAAVAARHSLALAASRDEVIADVCRRALWGSYGNEMRAVLAAAQSGNMSLLDAPDTQAGPGGPQSPLAATARPQRKGS
jgi:hypothetical protein